MVPEDDGYSQDSLRYLHLGIAAYDQGKYASAIQFFEMALAEEAEMGEAYNNRGLAQVGLGQYELALADFDEAARLLPKSGVPLSNRGSIYLLMGEYDRAQADLDQAIQREPGLARAYYIRGILFVTKEAYSLALADLDKAIELTPETGFVLQLTVESRAGQSEDRPASALSGLTGRSLEMIQRYADLPNAYLQRAMARAGLGQREAALADLEHALQLDADLAGVDYVRYWLSTQTLAAESLPPIQEPHVVPATDLPPTTEAFPATATAPGIAPTLVVSRLEIRSLVFVPGDPWVLYAALPDGVYRTTNGRETWALFGPASTVGQVRALAAHPDRSGLVFAAGEMGLFFTPDGGGHWARVEGMGLPAGAVQALAFEAAAPYRMYAATASKVYRSADDGQSWQAVFSSLPGGEALALVFDPKQAQQVYAGTKEGLYRSQDGGKNWRLVFWSLPVTGLAFDPAAPARLYAGRDDGWFYTSDGGENWTVVYAIDQNAVLALACDPRGSGVCYAAATSGVYRQDGREDSWRLVSENLGASYPR